MKRFPLVQDNSDTVTPTIGVKAFLKSIGSLNEIAVMLTQAGLKVTITDLSRFNRANQMPRLFYETIKMLGKDNNSGENNASGDEVGAIEVYFDGKPLGLFELAHGVTVVLKKRQNRIKK